MTNSWLAWLAAVLMICAPTTLGQDDPGTGEVAEVDADAGRPVEPGADYTGGWLTWPRMTGDWGGVRTDLEASGIKFDLGITQILQHNWHGGANTHNALDYSGTADLWLELDLGKMGLIPGMSIMLTGEPRFGDGVQSDVGSLLPVNLDAAKPDTGDTCSMTLSEYYIQQVLFEGKLILLAGKLDGSRAFDRNAFANNEKTQFMNVGLRNVPMIPSFLPYSVMGVGVIVNPTDWLSIMTGVTDSEGTNNTTGFETTFHGTTHTTVIHEWAFKINPWELPGNQRVGFAWSSMEVNNLAPISPFKEAGPLLMQYAPFLFNALAPLLPYERNPDNVMLYYNFDQYLYTEADDPTQGLGVFGRFSWAHEDANPINYFYSIGLSGKGLIPQRDQDTCGIGYYFVDLSNNLPPMMHSEQGIECYYNIEIAPWWHITPDLQIIVNPGGSDANDVALVGGLRMQMDL